MSSGPVETQVCPHCIKGFGGKWWTDPIHFDDVEPGDQKWGYRAIACPVCKQPIIILGERIGTGQLQKVRPLVTAWPKATSRTPLPPEVPNTFATDYREACLVVGDSPKSAAALGRRCLQQLLRDHVKVKAKDNLADQIQEVLDSHTLPSDLADDIDAIRNIGNFAAHPMKSTQSGLILDVEPEEAEWTLNVLEELFDFYFVRPKQRAAQRGALNAKLQTAKKNAAIKKPTP